MRTPLAFLALALLVSAPAFAGARACNATLASGTCNSVCSANGDALVFFSISTTDPDGAGPLLALSTRLTEAISWKYDHARNAIGAETKTQFAERMIRQRIFRDLIAEWENNLEEQAKAARLATNPVPASVGN